MTSADRIWWKRYSRYLNSEGWQLVREAAFRRDGYRYRRCGGGNSPFNPLQANHLSYDAYNATGRTPVSDLETLCRSCHQTITGRKFQRTFGLWRWWWRLTLRQKAVLVLAAWLALVLIRDALVPAGVIRQVSGVPASSGDTLIIPSKSKMATHHHRHMARKTLPPPG
jgi:hypothetical protein